MSTHHSYWFSFQLRIVPNLYACVKGILEENENYK